MPSNMKQDEIDALTGLRGIAALWVFLFHAGNFARRIDSEAYEVMRMVGGAGYLGVDVFFVLSGFILAHRYGESGLHTDLGRYGGFLWKRLARIYPVHVLALVMLVILQGGFGLFGITFIPGAHLGLNGLLASVTLTHSWNLPVERTWNTVSWSISAEWAAYLLFPAVALLASRVHSRMLTYALIPAIFVGLGMFIANSAYSGTMAYGMPRLAAEFTAGVFLHRLWMLRDRERDRRFGRLALLAMIALIPVGNLVAANWRTTTPMMVMPILACCIVYGLAAGLGPVTRCAASSLTTYAGRISYSFYMVHGLILSAFTVALKRTDLAGGLVSGLLVIALVFAVTTVVADRIHRWFEVPYRRSMIARMGRWSSRRLVSREPAG